MDTRPCGQIYGLLGYPVKHSFSPAMHNAAFKALGIDAQYQLFEVKPQELGDFLGSIQNKGIAGLNVTIPYKEKVLDFVQLDSESSYLKQLRAVNTIVIKDGILKGFNTDVAGFARHLREYIDPKGKKVAILGAGGASRAVAYAIADSGAKDIVLYDIELDRAEKVVETIKSIFADAQIRFVKKLEQLDIPRKDILINATPIGMKEADPCLVSKEILHYKLFVYDLIYNPPQTKLLELAKSKGAKTSNGLGMLLYQGMLSFELWTAQKAPYDVMRRALEEEIERVGHGH